MTIQVSIIIWTIICFLLLMLILHNLLFTPVLRVMDERKKRIDAARQKKELAEQISKENELRIAAQRDEYLKQNKRNEKLLVEQIKTDGKKLVAEAQQKRLSNVESYREQLKRDYDKIIDTVSPEIKRAAEIFSEKIISNRI